MTRARTTLQLVAALVSGIGSPALAERGLGVPASQIIAQAVAANAVDPGSKRTVVSPLWGRTVVIGDVQSRHSYRPEPNKCLKLQAIGPPGNPAALLVTMRMDCPRELKR